ncbi:TPA: YqaE/Pmp3 family membrane protein [Escherichia coli]
MGFWRIVITIILPPLGVLLGKGFGWAFIINILLTLLGYIPGEAAHEKRESVSR